MTYRESTRPIYDDDLRTRLDAAMARAQRFLDSTMPIRAKTFTPFCLACQQAGRTLRPPRINSTTSAPTATADGPRTRQVDRGEFAALFWSLEPPLDRRSAIAMAPDDSFHAPQIEWLEREAELLVALQLDLISQLEFQLHAVHRTMRHIERLRNVRTRIGPELSNGERGDAL